MLAAEAFEPDAQRPAAEIGAAADDDTGWLSTGMRIDYLILSISAELVRRRISSSI